MACQAAAARPLRLSALCSRIQPELRTAPVPVPVPVLVPSRRNTNVQAATRAGGLKTINDLPGPSTARTLYWIFVKGYADRSHLLQDLQKSLYGPIWRSRFGSFDLVNVASPELISQVIQQEGRYPVRAVLPHWKEYRQLRGQADGLHVGTGPEWYRLRSVLNPKMLKLREVSAFSATVHNVVGDLLQRIEHLRHQSQDRTTVRDLTSELYKFGFEGISSILFETRLGCLQEQIPEDTLRFIAATGSMLMLSDLVTLFPRWTRSILPFWKRFVQAWDDLYGVARMLIDRRIAEINAQVSSGEPAEGMYLTYLLSSDKITRAEVDISVTELLLGGVDTTSNTLSWTLYHLARDGRAQERLYREVDSVCPHRREPTLDDIGQMPFLKAVIKETLRLYPVVPGNGRFVSENEVVVDNYWFPRKTQFHLCHYTVSHDEAQFVDPESFIPERWLRRQTARGQPVLFQHHPYSFIPFGVGVRGCVGKRVAEMEMYFALSRLMQHYKIQPEVGAPAVKPKTRILMIPSKPINLRFLPRT
ncbi:sterol 26-hydroxylase, mitochondrial isoform X2 [Echeneis naucrates]|uniref:Sterol 26-hydroxylase, mitochondrial-like n=1 Tax=Echeneis naucrates TaxID=173247 RepID=A0A665W530_ECHNA|nr:sterol 26-hydroxylase, mitochondrial-like isoform X2 [Echeneis naucrates]